MQNLTKKLKKSEIQLFNREKSLAIFDEKIEIRERCKGVHCVDLGESFPTSIYLQQSASIQPRTSPSKFGGKIQFNIHSPPRSCPRRASKLQSWCRMARCQARSSRCGCLRSGVAGDGGLGSRWGLPSLSWEDSGRGLRALWRVHRQRAALTASGAIRFF